MQSSPIAHQRVLNYAYVDTDTLYQDFQIPQQGYNEKQVEESRIAYGRNVLSAERRILCSIACAEPLSIRLQ